MPRTPEQFEEIRKERRKLIKDAALKLFATQGYENTSISLIAQEAGISKGLMYNYFKSKDELLQNIMDGLSEELADMLDPNHDGEVTDEEASDFLDSLFNMLVTRTDELKLYYQLSFQPKVVEFLKNNFERSKTLQRQQLLIEYFGSKLPLPDYLSSLFTISSYMKGLVMVYVYSPELFSNDFLEQYKEYLKDILVRNKPFPSFKK